MEKSKKLIGAGVALAAVAAAATYFLTGRRGEKNRAKIEAWTLKMKAEIVERLRKLKEINQQKYEELVEEVAARYQRVEKVSAEEIERLTPELKQAWKHISKELKGK
jgi:gas vesicle protein